MFDDLIGQYVVEALENLEKWEGSCLKLEQGFDESSAKQLYRIAHNLKGGAQIFGLEELIKFCHRLEDLLRPVMNRECEVTPGLIGFLLQTEVVLRHWISQLNDNSKFLPDLGVIRPRLEQLIAAAANRAQADPQEATSEPADPKSTAKKVKRAATEGTVGSNGTIRVAATKLDELIQLIGELSLNQSIVNQFVGRVAKENEVFANAVASTSKIAKALQTAALDLRMQPLQGVFQRLRRTAADLVRTQNKEVEIEIVGEDVALDRTVIERVTEPLIHCIRNAIDHGVETPAERKQFGKLPKALLRIQALNEAGGVGISISDDGRGIDTDLIFKKAIEKGLIEAHAELGHRERMELIFLPGFSTAATVTDVSGRGIGMDIVKNAVDALGGELAVESELGIGTTIRMNLPINLSIMDALVVEVDGLDYAVPTKDLSEVIDLNDYRVESSGQSQKMISLRGRVVPLNPLRRYLPQSRVGVRAVVDGEWGTLPALVYESEFGKFAFWVDAVKQQQQVFVRPLADHLAHVPGIAGATILSNGEPSMIVSLPVISKRMTSKMRSA